MKRKEKELLLKLSKELYLKQEELDKLKFKPDPPKPPKDREVHLGGFSRHKKH